MKNIVQHIYKFSPSQGGLLYAWFLSMHTRVDLALCGEQGEEALMRVVNEVHGLLCRLEKMANYYNAESELAILNRTAALSTQEVSPELYEMIDFCIAHHAHTAGCFDVTIHSVNHTPDAIHQIRLFDQTHSLFFSRPGITINLSGFLKGYALEKIRQVLKFSGISDALINMGNSSVLALGHHPLTDGWKVGFGQIAGQGSQEISLQDECLTTSGNDSFERKHIINSKSGKLVEGKRMVAVITTDGRIGEVLSTSLFVGDACQRNFLKEEYHPRLILDF